MFKLCSNCKKRFSADNERRHYYCGVPCRRRAAQRRFRLARKKGVPLTAKSEVWKKAVTASKRRVLMASYAQAIRDRNHKYEFSITPKQFGVIIFSNCHYCGAPPSIKTKSGGLLRNGIDRVDHSIGYSSTNCVPACWLCNRMKWQLSSDAFLNHVRKINNFQA